MRSWSFRRRRQVHAHFSLPILGHKKDPGIPNSFPYKEQILAEIAEQRRLVSFTSTCSDEDVVLMDVCVCVCDGRKRKSDSG